MNFSMKFLTNGLSKKKKVDNDLRKFQHLSLASAECENATSVIHWQETLMLFVRVKAFWGTGTNFLFPLIENFAIFKGV